MANQLQVPDQQADSPSDIRVDFQAILDVLRNRVGEEVVTNATTRAALNQATEENARLRAQVASLQEAVGMLQTELVEIKEATKPISPDLGGF